MNRAVVFLVTILGYWAFLMFTSSVGLALIVGVVISVIYGRWSAIYAENELRRSFGYPEFTFFGKVKK